MNSIKTKLNLFGILTILFTLILTTISIAWVLTENNITQSKIELQENMKMVQAELEFNKKRLLSSSQKTAELQELDLKIKHITRNKDNYNQNIQPLYIRLANATHDAAKIAGDIWKTMIYDKDGDLISFSHIEQDYSKKGYAFNFPNAEFMIANGEILVDPLFNPWTKVPKYDGFDSHFKEAIPDKETIIYSKNDSKLTMKSFYPIMGLNFNKNLRKMTPSPVGFVLEENPLDYLFIDKIKKLISNKEINIYALDKNTMNLTIGTLEQYKILSKIYSTNKKVKIEGINYIQEILPLYNNDKLIGAIALLQIEKTITDYVFQLLKSLIIVFIIILFIVIPFTLMLIRTITKPIINLQQGIKELSSGNLGKQLDIYSQDEIGQLTMSFNDMSKELAKTDKIKILNTQLEKTSQQLRVAKEELEELNISLENRVDSEIAKNKKHQHIMMEQTKRAQMGEMIENIAHQWRQPLAQINSAILLTEAILENSKFENEKVTMKFLEVESLTTYMSKTINDFQEFVNPDKLKETFFLDEAIKKSLLITQGSLKSHNIEVIINMDKTITCKLYKNELEQVLVILINNARDVFINREIQNPKIFINTQKNDTHNIIEVADNAGGIDNNIIEKIFDPYFTTKHKTQGTGLGLYMATMILESGLNAQLTVQNTSKGASFKILIEDEKV